MRQTTADTLKAEATPCEGCGGTGWLLVNIDGNEAPPTMAYLKKCDLCDYFKTDFWAALAYNKAGNGALLGVVVRNEKH